MKIPFAALLLLIHLSSMAQPRVPGQQLIKRKCRTEYLSLRLNPTRPVFPPELDSIAVLDYRRDTSRIGIVNGGGRTQKELLLHSPVPRQISAWLNAEYASPKGNHNLLIVLKDLWLSDATIYNHRFGNYDYYFSIWLEAYVKTTKGYTPLVRVDTVLSVRSAGSIAATAAWVLPDMLTDFMYRVSTRSFAVDSILRRTVTFEQIDSSCRKRFDYPMDTANTLVKGVYANISEFLNNSPSITQYELAKDKGGDLSVSVPDGNGHFVYTHTMWGLCDGAQLYVMMDGNLFPVFQVHHQFYVLGSKEYSVHRIWVPLGAPLPGGSIVGTADVGEKVVRDLHLFRLDIKTGEVIE